MDERNDDRWARLLLESFTRFAKVVRREQETSSGDIVKNTTGGSVVLLVFLRRKHIIASVEYKTTKKVNL